MQKLSNKYCEIEYNPNYNDKTDCLTGRDLIDQINMPAFYSQTVKGHKNAWETLKENWTEHTTMLKAVDILLEAGIITRAYCEMD